MGYFERLSLISPGTLVATSRGVAEYIASGSLAGGLSISRPLLQLKRRGCMFVELGDEWMSTIEDIAAGVHERGPKSI